MSVSNPALLDRIIKETQAAIEKAKKQIFEIAENARKEVTRAQVELEEVKRIATETINEVDKLERRAKMARLRLLEVDSNFKMYTEEDIKTAYEKAHELQLQLTRMRDRENQLRLKRDEIERRLLALQETVEKAESIMTQVGIVMDFIGGSLQDVNVKLEGLQQRQGMSYRIIKAQEEERKRVAREIHDGPAQAMANIVLRVEFCEKLLDFDPNKVRGELSSLKAMVRTTLQDVRKIIFDLRPMTLDDLGLVPAVKRYLEDYSEKNNLKTEMIFFGQERRFASGIEVGLFRIIQEALNNVWKHAEAKKVTVRIDLGTEKILVMVKDDGKGFDMARLQERTKHSFGFTSMRERAELLDGEVNVTSAIGKGTEVRIKVPVQTE